MGELLYKMNEFDANALIPNAYSYIDAYTDNFAKIARVQTDLIWGNKNSIIKPWISIIIPTFNRSELLKESIQSVLKQQQIDFLWEIIVIDNTPFMPEATFSALSIVKELNDPRILLYHNRENIGSGYNWNRGVELARGIWVCFLHDDDILYPDALNNICRIIIKNQYRKKPLGYIKARFDEFSCNQSPYSLQRHNKNYFLELTRLGTLITYYTRTGIPTCGTTILKQAYIESGGINYDFGPTADAVLGYQIMRNYTILLSDVSLGAYRWGVNETLKLDTSKKLVYADYLFAQYCWQQSWYAKIWGKVFGKVQHSRNITAKIRDVNRLEKVAGVEDFSDPFPYEKSPKLKLFILRAIIYSYREICKMKARIKGYFM